MKLVKILVRYFPPGLGLEYVQNGETKNKMVDLFQLKESTDIEALADQLMKKERLLTNGTRPYLLLTLTRLRSKLKDDVKHKFYLHRTMEHILPITNVKFNKDGSKCLTGSFDRTCKIWNTTSGNLSTTLEGHTGVVFDITFNYPFDDRIISASFDKTAMIWDGESGEKLTTLWGHTEEVVVVQYDFNKQCVATGSMDHTGKLFDLPTGIELWVVDGHGDALVALEFSSDGNYLLSGSFDSSVFLWDTRTHSKVGSFSGHQDSISRCLFNYDTTLVATGSIDRTAKIWDRRNLKECFHLEHEDEVLDLAFDSVGARLAAAEGNGHVQVWDVKKNSELLFCLSGHTCEVSKVCFSPGGGQLLTASSDGTARLWSARDGRALQLLDGHTDEVFSCAFSYTGESILTASKDKTCRLWKMQPIIDDGY